MNGDIKKKSERTWRLGLEGYETLFSLSLHRPFDKEALTAAAEARIGR